MARQLLGLIEGLNNLNNKVLHGQGPGYIAEIPRHYTATAVGSSSLIFKLLCYNQRPSNFDVVAETAFLSL